MANARGTPLIRVAREDDAPALVALLEQLGYAVSEAHVTGVLAARSVDLEVLVAAVAERVAGAIEVRLTAPALAVSQEAEITALVVDERERGSGVGAALLRRAETWARERGLATIAVRSNVIRERAHAFYAREGYARVKAQALLRKELSLFRA